MGILTAKEANIANHSQVCMEAGKPYAVMAWMSVVPTSKYMASKAKNKSTDPARVKRKNLKAE